MNTTKRVLVTGISGSIGCHLFAHLMHNTDWHVVGIASFKHKGLSDKISVMFKLHPEWQERLTLVTHDLFGPISEITKKEIGHIDYIINLAALSDVHISIEEPVTFIQNNVWSTLNMLEFARGLKGLEAFVQFSTDEVYGPTDGKTGYKEWEPSIPSNPYAASKVCQEAIAISYWRTYNIPLIITNTMNNFGELQQPNKFPVMVQKAVAKGEKIKIHAEPNGEIGSRSYIHSRNVSDAVLFILKNSKPYMHQPSEIDRPDRYNITGEKQLTNLELAQLIAKLMGKELKYTLMDSTVARPGHDPHYGLDGSKLEKMGWKSPVSFEESLRNTIVWQESHPEWLK
jgi:dTDP-glucose 4,6-dehydratase